MTFWNKSKLDGNVVAFSHSFLAIRLTLNNFSLYFFNIYAPNTRNGHALVWEEISIFMADNKEATFMLAGDFNTPLYPSENSLSLGEFGWSN